MNKRHFLALIAIFFITLGASAQTAPNNYKMVLTLTDGTVVTIGPNDLQNIEFIEGEINATGTNITDLLNQMEKMKVDITALTASVDKSQTDIKALQDNMEAMQKTIENKMADNKAELKAYTNNAITALQKSIKDQLQAEIAENNIKITQDYTKAIADCQVALQESIESVNKQVAVNAKDIGNIREQANKNAADIAENKVASEKYTDMAVADLQNQVNEQDNALRSDLDNLIKLLGALEAKVKALEGYHQP